MHKEKIAIIEKTIGISSSIRAIGSKK